MKRILALAFVLLIGLAGTSGAVVLTFDDITTDPLMYPMTTPYGGLNWSGFGVVKDSNHPISGYNVGTVSPHYVAFNGFEAIGIVSDTKFNFLGAYFTGAWNDGLTIRISAYYQHNLVGNFLYTVDSDFATFLAPNIVGIDELSIASYGGTPDPDYAFYGAGTHFAMDNFQYTVPEPGTLILLGSGLLGLAITGARKKFRK